MTLPTRAAVQYLKIYIYLRLIKVFFLGTLFSCMLFTRSRFNLILFTRVAIIMQKSNICERYFFLLHNQMHIATQSQYNTNIFYITLSGCSYRWIYRYLLYIIFYINSRNVISIIFCCCCFFPKHVFRRRLMNSIQIPLSLFIHRENFIFHLRNQSCTGFFLIPQLANCIDWAFHPCRHDRECSNMHQYKKLLIDFSHIALYLFYSTCSRSEPLRIY